MSKLRDYTIETFRNGYCERYIIQARSIKEAEKIAIQEHEINLDIVKGNGYFVF